MKTCEMQMRKVVFGYNLRIRGKVRWFLMSDDKSVLYTNALKKLNLKKEGNRPDRRLCTDWLRFASSSPSPASITIMSLQLKHYT